MGNLQNRWLKHGKQIVGFIPAIDGNIQRQITINAVILNRKSIKNFSRLQRAGQAGLKFETLN
jgi:hypothetical protein